MFTVPESEVRFELVVLSEPERVAILVVLLFVVLVVPERAFCARVFVK